MKKKSEKIKLTFMVICMVVLVAYTPITPALNFTEKKLDEGINNYPEKFYLLGIISKDVGEFRHVPYIEGINPILAIFMELPSGSKKLIGLQYGYIDFSEYAIVKGRELDPIIFKIGFINAVLEKKG